MESFYTIQGEGYWQGSAAYFIRLGGCDVGCVWCDVKESWDVTAHPSRTIKSLLTEVKTTAAKIVVVTGGEPLMHNLENLTRIFKENGLQLNIETSGSSPLSGEWDWICLSPKKFKKPLPDILLRASELKIIIYNKSDFKWAEEYASQVNNNCKLYLQPEWSRHKEMTPLIVDYVKQNPKWKICVQVHKYIDVP
ncbi:MAG: 4Fe-4S cluster-binding domain-containing protein [Bacteroidetes bacterium]|nr:4Fe-4S cluster-binding domain-containing protein [Bacteroidota bacterium]